MSIATLKRKTLATARISGKQNGGFSLQGGHRNQGWVGQGSRGRSLGGTAFRGTVPRGAGGTNGLYPSIINNKGSCCSNDPSVVKRTTMTYKNYIDRSVPAKIWVKDFSPLNHSQSSRINRISREEGAWGAKEVHEMDAGYDSCSPNCGSASYHIGGKKYVREMYAKKLNYLEDGGEMYQRTGLMQKKNLPPPAPCKVIPGIQNLGMGLGAISQPDGDSSCPPINTPKCLLYTLSENMSCKNGGDISGAVFLTTSVEDCCDMCTEYTHPNISCNSFTYVNGMCKLLSGEGQWASSNLCGGFCGVRN